MGTNRNTAPVTDDSSAATTSGSGRVLSLLIVGYTCLLLAWAFGLPAMGGADEWQHYSRALSVANGQLVGEPVDYLTDPNLTEEQRAWVDQATRQIEIPPNLSPRGYGCNAFQPEKSAACQVDIVPDRSSSLAIPNGTYQPWAYFIPGFAETLWDSPIGANLAGRAASTAVFLLLVSLSAVLLRSRPAAVVGIVVGVSPMVLHVAATVNPSGLEIGAGAAFTVSLLILMSEGKPGRLVWASASLSGTLLILSRSLGPVWLLLLSALAALFGSAQRITVLVTKQGLRPVFALAPILVAIAVNRVWEATYGPEVFVSLSPLGPTIGQALGMFDDVLPQQVGVFGYLDTQMPFLGYIIWGAMAVALLTLAMAVGAGRERVALGLGILTAILVPVLLWGAVLRHTGFGIQGRHVLIFSTALALFCGLVWERRSFRLPTLPRWAVVSFLSIPAGLVHLLAWFSSARRHAVGVNGPIWFFEAADWAPPAGWLPWTLFAVTGSCLLMVTGFALARISADAGLKGAAADS